MRGNSPSMYESSLLRQDLLISEKTNIHILVNLLATFTKVALVCSQTRKKDIKADLFCYKKKIQTSESVIN